MTLGSRLGSRDNNFDLLRLTAALLVVFAHSWNTSLNTSDPVSLAIGYGLGNVGLMVFFTISGLLIAKSAEQNGLFAFAVSRGLRILPALLAVTVFEAFVVAPIFFDGDARAFLTSAAPWEHLKNATVFLGRFQIDGVFVGHAKTGLNGSTWTLPIEAALYVVVAMAATAGCLTRRTCLAAFVACWSLYAYMTAAGHTDFVNNGPEIIRRVHLYPFAKWGSFFLLGAVFWKHRDSIRLDGRLALLCLGSLLLLKGMKPVTCVPFAAYLVVYVGLGLRSTAGFFERTGDISYGIYVFSWPIQQWCIAVSSRTITPVELAAISIPISVLVGFASWTLIEKPALGLRRILLRKGPILAGADTGVGAAKAGAS